MSEWLYRITRGLETGYTLTAILLLLAMLVLPNQRGFLQQWQSASHLIVMIPLGFYVFSWIYSGILLAQLKSEEGEFISSRFALNTPYGLATWALFILQFLLFILLFFKRCRRSVIIALLTLFVLNFEWIVVIVTFLFRDYLPSS